MRISARLDSGLNLDRRSQTAPRRTDAPQRAQLPAVIEPRTERSATASSRPVAALVAQLVAHAEDMPVTREHRRAEPSAGTDAYRSMANLGADPDGGPHTARMI
jgi:hypothetical protein